MNCGDVISIPAHAPERMRWSYRTAGPFRSSNQSDGAYSVLLTLRFFSMLYDGSTTALFSFNATKNQTKIEADLGLLFKKSLSHWTNTRIKTIFAECKTFNHFKPNDVRRMQTLGAHFPDAFLVFATLRNALEDHEKELLRPFVERNRKKAEKGKVYNSIVVLTGIELLSPTLSGPPFCWEEIGGKYAAFERRISVGRHLIHLSDATQQLYLDMEGYRYLPLDDD